MIYVILGMHKSGTTLVTEMLHQSGINMGDFDESLTYDQSNKSERHETQELNRELLHGLLIPPLGYLMRKPFRPPLDPAGYRRNKDSIAIIRTRALERLRQTTAPPPTWLKLIDDLNGRYTDWGFKDPRTCLTYPVWQRALPEHKVIIVYRHFDQLIQRYKVKKWDAARLFRVLHGWTVYNQSNLNVARAALHPTLLLNYEKLMSEEQEFDRLCRFVGRPLVDVRRPQLYRNRATNQQAAGAIKRFITPLLPVYPQELFDQLDGLRVQTVSSV